jgi:hypothetical protein
MTTFRRIISSELALWAAAAHVGGGGVWHPDVYGRLAQLGERLVYTQEVGGSTPSPPIDKDPA